MEISLSHDVDLAESLCLVPSVGGELLQVIPSNYRNHSRVTYVS